MAFITTLFFGRPCLPCSVPGYLVSLVLSSSALAEKQGRQGRYIVS
jgi:hypothetical protein